MDNKGLWEQIKDIIFKDQEYLEAFYILIGIIVTAFGIGFWLGMEASEWLN